MAHVKAVKSEALLEMIPSQYNEFTAYTMDAAAWVP
jgi:hypothetical protein